MSPFQRGAESTGLDLTGLPDEEGVDPAQAADDLEQEPDEKQNRTDGSDGSDRSAGTDGT